MELLDHIGLEVSDLSQSIAWYRDVLQLKELHFEKWNRYPVMMKGGQSTIALFDGQGPPSNIRKVFHFAFRVEEAEYQRYKKHFEVLGVPYRESDHHYFHSVYIIDPDGYEVELTMATELTD